MNDSDYQRRNQVIRENPDYMLGSRLGMGCQYCGGYCEYPDSRSDVACQRSQAGRKAAKAVIAAAITAIVLIASRAFMMSQSHLHTIDGGRIYVGGDRFTFLAFLSGIVMIVALCGVMISLVCLVIVIPYQYMHIEYEYWRLSRMTRQR